MAAPKPRKIRMRKRFQRAVFGRKGASNPKQRVAAIKRAQTRRLKGR